MNKPRQSNVKIGFHFVFGLQMLSDILRTKFSREYSNTCHLQSNHVILRTFIPGAKGGRRLWMEQWQQATRAETASGNVVFPHQESSRANASTKNALAWKDEKVGNFQRGWTWKQLCAGTMLKPAVLLTLWTLN